MKWWHLNVFNKKCVIVYALPRERRANDGKVYRGRRLGKPQQALHRGVGAFALAPMREILGESDQRWLRMLCAHMGAAYADLSLEEVTWAGPEEMRRRKWRKALTVFADLVQKLAAFASPERPSTTWELLVAELLRDYMHQKPVSEVAVDMSDAYGTGVRENLADARIVYDKLHVVHNAVEACDKVRNSESWLIPESQERLERTRWLWRKNPENWTAKEAQRWEAIAKERGATGLAYEMCCAAGHLPESRRQ